MTSRKAPQPAPKKPAKITQMHIENAGPKAQPTASFERYVPVPGVIPKEKAELALAMDSTPYEVLNAMNVNLDYSGFRGYPILATMAQQVEYANMVQVVADELVRNWISVKSTEAGDKDVELMLAALEKYDVKRLIHEASLHDSIFGVAHVFVDVGVDNEKLANPLLIDSRAIKKGDLLGFRCVDPTWIYPAMYNTSFPLRADFYKPQAWYVMGTTVHESRFMDIVTRPVRDIIKPSYNFSGLSLVQLMEPYVQDWRDVKRNVVQIIKSLRMRGLKTDMDARLEEPGQFDKRIDLFTQYQDNQGIWAFDVSEDLIQMQTSLSDLSNLLSNYQEQMCTPARITNLKYLGSAPAGLNASGESEIETWHETVSGMQEHFARLLQNIFKIIQLSEFGELKPNIYFEFNPLDEMGDEERANINKVKVDTIAVAVQDMIVSTDEARQALKSIDGAGFEDLGPAPGELDELPDDEE